MRRNYIDTAFLGSHAVIQAINIGEASMVFMNSTQDKHRLPTRLYTKSKKISYGTAPAKTVNFGLPALLQSYDIINNVFVQIRKHSCKSSGGALISKTFNIWFDVLLTPLHPGAQLALSAELERIQRSLDVQPLLLH